MKQSQKAQVERRRIQAEKALEKGSTLRGYGLEKEGNFDKRKLKRGKKKVD